MKPTELKQQYIELRAEGRSYSYIASQLHISKSTCSKWEEDLAVDIYQLQRARRAELYQAYSMTKEARIKRLGDTLEKIDAALDKVDFSKVDPAKLLDYKLKYTAALKGEYISYKAGLRPDEVEPKNVLAAYVDLYNRIRDGDITAEQAAKESLALNNILKAYEIVDLKPRLDGLEAAVLIGGRINA